MRCPWCGTQEVKATEDKAKLNHRVSRTISGLETEIKRVRECYSCKEPFITIESTEE